MSLRRPALAHALLLACAVALTGCASSKYAFQKENFDEKGPFDRHYAASKQVVYQAMKRVALRQGFAVERESEEAMALVVSKQYQDGSLNTLLTLSGIAMGGGKSTDAWIAAQEVTLKSSEVRQTTSLGIGFGISIPIPTGTTSSLTKERGETIKDKAFYDKMFAAIEKEIPVVSEQLAANNVEDDQRIRAEIEKKLRIEMEIRAKLEQEHKSALASPAGATPVASAVPLAATVKPEATGFKVQNVTSANAK